MLQPLPPVFFFTVPLTNCQMSSTESSQLMPSFNCLYHICRQHLSPLKFQPLSSLTLHMIYDFHPLLHFHLQFLLDPQLRLYLHLRLHLHISLSAHASASVTNAFINFISLFIFCTPGSGVSELCLDPV